MAEVVHGPGAPMDTTRPASMVVSRRAQVIGLLEEQPMLETAQQKVTGRLQPLVDWSESIGLKDLLHGRFVGHSLHPIATDLPIGFWTSAIVLDTLRAKKSARTLTAVGCASALVAAASGTADWTATHGRERRLALLHGMLNLAGLACQTAALVSRRHYTRWSWI